MSSAIQLKTLPAIVSEEHLVSEMLELHFGERSDICLILNQQNLGQDVPPIDPEQKPGSCRSRAFILDSTMVALHAHGGGRCTCTGLPEWFPNLRWTSPFEVVPCGI